MTDIYKQGLFLGLRFEFKGVRTIEDLTSLKVEELDTIYGALSDEKDKRPRRSLLATNDDTDDVLDLQLAIIKDIVDTKQAEKMAKQSARERAAQRQKILGVLASKEQTDLEGKSTEELRQMLEGL